jgi:hypothetical protein
MSRPVRTSRSISGPQHYIEADSTVAIDEQAEQEAMAMVRQAI